MQRTGDRAYGLGIDGDGLQAVAAQRAYEEWVRRKHVLQGYVEHPLSDSPLGGLLWVEVRLGYALGHITDFDRQVFEWVLQGWSPASIVGILVTEPVMVGRHWEARPLTEQRVRDITKRVRSWVCRTRHLGLVTVVVEELGWDALGELLFG